jgi:hypothetical protein
LDKASVPSAVAHCRRLFGLGLALKSDLWLGFVELWLRILKAKAKPWWWAWLGQALAYLSQGFEYFFNNGK